MNRLKKYAALFVVGTLSLSLAACDQGLTELNENPNAPTEPTVELVLPQVQKALIEMRAEAESGPDSYMQYRGELLYVSSAIYERPNTNGEWSEFYTDILANANYIRSRGQELDDPNVEALALIHRAFAFQVMTDIWGPIPYSEANRGRDTGDDLVLSPTYDSQEDVYKGIINELNTAIDMIETGGSVSGDLIYSGDMFMWKKFANSLLLRFYMRLSEAAPSFAESGIQEVYNRGEYITTNEENALFEYKPFPNSHPMHIENRLREDDKVSATLIDTLKFLNDPRLSIYAAPNHNDDEFIGLPPGVDKGHGFTNSEVSPFGAYMVSPTHPAIVMSAAEVHFVLAEAAARDWISADAESHYNEGIRTGMLMYDPATVSTHLSGFAGDEAFNTLQLEADEFPNGITEQEVNDYLAQQAVSWDASQWRELIGLQKWLLYGENQPYEGWFEWRRLGHPELEPGPDALLDQIPVRLPYPENEQSFNNSNLQKAIDMLGGPDEMTTSVWWDQ